MVRVGSLFSQILTLFSRTEFGAAVKKHRAEHYSKGFSSWDQFVAMLFCQLAQAKSLREISSGLSCCLGKLRHLGMRKAPAKSTLAYANEHRPWELYETLFHQLLSRCQELARGRTTFRFRNKLYSFDSSVVDLCVTMFDWARFRRTKGAIKLHLLLDHDGYLPSFAVVTNGRVSDVKMAWALELPPDSIIVMDRAYVDYLLWGQWCQEGVWFVTRMKEGTSYRVLEQREVAEGRGVECDQVIELSGREAAVTCPHRLRRIRYRDPETGDVLVFLTNHLGFASSTIARIYKDRWQVELFFKALKQNLKIKTFVGTSANAVRVQIWTALIAMLVLKYLQMKGRYGWALSNLVALLRWNLFTYRDLWQWIDDPNDTPPIGAPDEQLALAHS